MRRVYNYLKNSFDVYFPGQHKGICEKPYIVIRESSQIAQIGTNQVGQRLVDIIIFSPKNSYIIAEEYREEVKKELIKFKLLRKTGSETPWIIDNDKEALTTSLLFTILKEL